MVHFKSWKQKRVKLCTKLHQRSVICLTCYHHQSQMMKFLTTRNGAARASGNFKIPVKSRTFRTLTVVDKKCNSTLDSKVGFRCCKAVHHTEKSLGKFLTKKLIRLQMGTCTRRAIKNLNHRSWISLSMSTRLLSKRYENKRHSNAKLDGFRKFRIQTLFFTTSFQKLAHRQ